MDKQKLKLLKRYRRRKRVRSKIFGTPERPRLSVYRSLRYIYAQIIDDTKGITLVSAKDKDLDEKVFKQMTKKQRAREVGKLIAKRAKEKNIDKVVFDRGPFLYHGRVKELAEGAREGGLIF